MRPLSLCVALSASAVGANVSQPALAGRPVAAAAPAPAATPLRGWNSWDSYKQNLNESAALKIAENMAKFLLPHGYDTLVIDGGWSDAYNHDNCTSCVDANGRAQPNVEKWPSSAGGKGLKPFIDKVHAMGLKVGMHTLQGSITRAALNANSPVLDAGRVTVNDIVGPGCTWQRWGFGVDLAQHPEAGQQYLDSVYSQYAEWGLDLIKNDCMFATNWDISGWRLIDGVKRAINKAARPTAYILSPGNDATLGQGQNVSHVADAFRITPDWHDCASGTWGTACGNLTSHFEQAHAFETLIGPTSFPYLDILSPYNLAVDPQDPGFRFQMTFWSIVRSPLFIGLDLSGDLEAPDLVQLTNPGVLAVNSHSTNNRQVKASAGSYVWAAEQVGDTVGYYVALLNHGMQAQEVRASFAEIGIAGSPDECDVVDVWTGQMRGTAAIGVVEHLPAVTGAELLLLKGCR